MSSLRHFSKSAGCTLCPHEAVPARPARRIEPEDERHPVILVEHGPIVTCGTQQDGRLARRHERVRAVLVVLLAVDLVVLVREDLVLAAMLGAAHLAALICSWPRTSRARRLVRGIERTTIAVLAERGIPVSFGHSHDDRFVLDVTTESRRFARRWPHLDAKPDQADRASYDEICARVEGATRIALARLARHDRNVASPHDRIALHHATIAIALGVGSLALLGGLVAGTAGALAMASVVGWFAWCARDGIASAMAPIAFGTRARILAVQPLWEDASCVQVEVVLAIRDDA